MRRHETDWLSLSVGGLYVVVAAVHIGTEGTGSSGHSLRWFIPATLLVLGVLGLIGATTRGRTPAVAPAGPYPTARPVPPVDTSTVDTSTVDTSTVDTSTVDTSTVDTSRAERPEDADQPDDVAHPARLDDELTVRLDGEPASDGESDEPDRPAPPGKPGADG